MAALLYQYQLCRSQFLCFPYRQRHVGFQEGRLVRLHAVVCAAEGTSESRGVFFPSFHGPFRSRRVVCKFEKSEGSLSSSLQEIKDEEDKESPPFDINIAVVLAGFAFEAYNTPSDQGRVFETDPFGCKTTFLSEKFLREVYSGKFYVNLKSGSQFPGLDLWGTSDPYVVLRIGECVARSKTVWATTTPVWNQQFAINVKDPSTKYLQVAAWDANLMTDDRRLGNSGVNLEDLSDGEKHEVRVELEGMGGGGILTMEVQYKCFEEIDLARKGWSIPILSEFLQGKKLDDIFKSNFGLESLTVRDFLRSVLGHSKLQSGNSDSGTQSESRDREIEMITNNNDRSSRSLARDDATSGSGNEKSARRLVLDSGHQPEASLDDTISEMDVFRELQKRFSETFGVSVENLGLPVFDKVSWDALDVITKLGLQSKKKAESQYADNGLAILGTNKSSEPEDTVLIESSVPQVEDVQKASSFLLKHTEDTLKSWAVLASSLTGKTKTDNSRDLAIVKDTATSDSQSDGINKAGSCEQLHSSEELEELRKMFGKAESAMEAWAVLASSLGHRSFVKSAFEKLCFIDNDKTDTQVALWRDAEHRRLVIAFRGTEQVKWKDLRTDLMLLPVSFSPERVGGDFKEEAKVHGGFLNAYDSVINRLKSLVKDSIGASNVHGDNEHPWQVYVTGHSLGGALATLAALELSTSRLSREHRINITMYNFGSPRVGNKRFADQYNEIVKDSWRVVNHLDIIPTVPRLMGYCHVATPIYLTAGDVQDATVNLELVQDGYNGDVIGEATPDFFLEEFMKGEKRLIERLLQTEIAMIQSIRDGSALMQHMEDFYYISLLEVLAAFVCFSDVLWKVFSMQRSGSLVVVVQLSSHNGKPKCSLSFAFRKYTLFLSLVHMQSKRRDGKKAVNRGTTCKTKNIMTIWNCNGSSRRDPGRFEEVLADRRYLSHSGARRRTSKFLIACQSIASQFSGAGLGGIKGKHFSCSHQRGNQFNKLEFTPLPTSKEGKESVEQSVVTK
ncbi:hypothetical protein GOP47_0012566 [Adiantum capillus-veneris]|uniref:C2 domain-containing protein n=1 Tax=Adiantum capillus-veneris TaxID=13818 RepID=A0A9D4ZGL0_ADICA|nr:hypothetical protein GOP47_0012566 [Adiantum capillus-veneris]